MSLRLTLGVVGLVASLGLGSSLVGCSDDAAESSGGGSNGGSSAGGATSGGAATFAGDCVPTDDSCYLSGQAGPGAECLAKHDNTDSTVWTGRFSYLKVEAPAALASELVQNIILNKGLALNQPQCFESGEATFVWLIQYDSTTGILKTGGGDPLGDPKDGACFARASHPTNPDLDSAPVEIAVPVNEDGTFSATIDKITVPVFLDAEKSSVVFLPLRGLEFSGKFSADHNCIGKSNLDEFSASNNCLPDKTANQLPWATGGDLGGFITVEDADDVVIDDISSSLCALIAGSEWKGDGGDCKSTAAWQAGERPDGDWCIATNAAATADCKDAWRLAASYAGSAIKINGDCP